MILLSLIAWKVGVFTAIVGLPFFPLVEKIVTNTYFSGVACSIIAVIIIYKWQVLYSKRKLKQDFRCNECIEGIYDGIEVVRKYMPLVPEKEKWDRVCDYEEFRKKNAKSGEICGKYFFRAFGELTFFFFHCIIKPIWHITDAKNLIKPIFATWTSRTS